MLNRKSCAYVLFDYMGPFTLWECNEVANALVIEETVWNTV